MQSFYHDGSKVGGYGYRANQTWSDSYSVAGAPYSLSFHYASNHIGSAMVVSNAAILESYSCSNGVFYPDSSSIIAKINKMMTDQLAH
jgi:hypothetical protein